MGACKKCYGEGWIEGDTIDDVEPPSGLVFVRRCTTCAKYPTDMAAARAWQKRWGTEMLGVVFREPQFTNHYLCPDDGTEWTMTWSCTCDDRCPTCNHEIEPWKSEDAVGDAVNEL